MVIWAMLRDEGSDLPVDLMIGVSGFVWRAGLPLTIEEKTVKKEKRHASKTFEARGESFEATIIHCVSDCLRKHRKRREAKREKELRILSPAFFVLDMFLLLQGVFDFVTQHVDIDWFQEIGKGPVLDNLGCEFHISVP